MLNLRGNNMLSYMYTRISLKNLKNSIHTLRCLRIVKNLAFFVSSSFYAYMQPLGL